MTSGRIAAVVFLDVVFVASVGLTVGIILTGGTELTVEGHRISIRSVTNPLLIAALLFAIRFALPRRDPFLGISSLRIDRAECRCLDLARSSLHWLHSQSAGCVAGIAAAVVLVTFLLKALNATWYRGFYSGDDVEIHQMTLGLLLGLDWPIWELRSPVYPMLFIYPAQAALLLAGHAETDHLILAGRAVVVIVSTASLVLVYMIAREIGGDSAVGLIAVLFYGFSRLNITFGSSELPRPVAAFFLLVSFRLLLRGGVARAAAAGVSLAFAGSLRFSEFIFFVPATLHVARHHRWSATWAFLGAGSAAAAVITGLADWLYWGSAWHSAEQVVRYTLVDQLSSRGYQQWHWYLSNVFVWTNPLVVALTAYGARLPQRGVQFWIWVPILLLSLLPHKETRYLVPVMPFLSISAAVAGWRLWHRLVSQQAPGAPERAAMLSLLALAVGVGSLLLEAGGFRFRVRSTEPVTIAKHVAREVGSHRVAAEQAWRAGTNLYLRDTTIIDLDPDKIKEWRYLCSRVLPADVGWLWLRRDSLSPASMAALHRIGYSPDERIDTSSYVLFRRLKSSEEQRCELEETRMFSPN